MPSPLAEAFLMGILNGCYETPSKRGNIGIALAHTFNSRKIEYGEVYITPVTSEITYKGIACKVIGDVD